MVTEMKNSLAVPPKVKELPYDPAISLPDMDLREMKTYVHTETCIHVFTSSLTIIAKGERTKWPLIDE